MKLVVGDGELRLAFLIFQLVALIKSISTTTTNITCTESAYCELKWGLEEMDCSGRRLTCIPKYDFDNDPLSKLNYRDNHIRILPCFVFQTQFGNTALSGLAKVEELDISSNQLQLIEPHAFEGLSALKTLRLHQNQLTVIKSYQFSQLQNLNKLTLNDNRISMLEPHAFEGPTNLIGVVLENNPLEIPITCIPCMPRWNGTFQRRTWTWHLNSSLGSTTILVPNVFLKQIPSDQRLGDLFTLDLSNNQITQIYPGAFNGITWLTTLNLNQNQLTGVPTLIFQQFSLLKNLSMRNNPIKRLESGDLFGPAMLLEIDLSECAIEYIDPRAFSCSSLIKLSLSGNKVKTITSKHFQKLPQLQTLLLDNNQIHTLETVTFQGLTNLKTVRMENNPVNVTQENCLPCFPVWNDVGNFSNDGTSWNLHSAGIPGIGTVLVKNIFQHQLRFCENAWFYDISKIETLDLSSNGISQINAGAFSGLKTLTNLKLDKNSLSKVPGQSFSGISQLKILSLKGNPLGKLGPEEFLVLVNLIELDLSDCELWAIDPKAFNGLTSLKNLDLSENQLTTMSLKPDTFISLNKLKVLRLGGKNITKAEQNYFEELKFLHVNSSGFNNQTQTQEQGITNYAITVTENLSAGITIANTNEKSDNPNNISAKPNSIDVLCDCDELKVICTGMWVKTSEGQLECQIQPHKNSHHNASTLTNSKSEGNGVNFEEFVFPGLVLLVLAFLLFQIISNFKRLFKRTTPALISVTWKPSTDG